MTDDSDRLSPDDARVLSVESPVVMGHTLKLNVLAPGAALDLDALRDSVSARLSAEPRATQRVDAARPEPRWITAEDFDIRDHVRRVDDTVATRTDLWHTVGGLMSEHLDRSKPLWTFDVIGPLADGRQAVAARIHHAMADGIAAVQFLRALLWDVHTEPPRSAAHPASAPDGSDLFRLPGALLREFGHRASRTPFDRPLTAARELAFADSSVSQLKAIGAARPEKATVNDVLLAVVAGGLREWLAVGGSSSRHLRAQIPVSLHSRSDGDAALGNHDSFMNVDLPLGDPDPVARLDRIRAETRARKQFDDADEIYDLMHALGRVGGLGAKARKLASNPREFSVSISNVPGPRHPVTVAGRAVALFTSSEPALHHALRISAISCADQLSIGLCTDPRALPDIARLAEAVERAYAELRNTAD